MAATVMARGMTSQFHQEMGPADDWRTSEVLTGVCMLSLNDSKLCVEILNRLIFLCSFNLEGNTGDLS